MVAVGAVCLHSSLLLPFRQACLPRTRGQGRAGVLRARVADPSLSVVHGGFRCGRGGMLGGVGCSALDLGQVGGQVVVEPAVAGNEGRGLRELVESRGGVNWRNWAAGLPCWGSRRGSGRRNWPARDVRTQDTGEDTAIRCPPPAQPCMRAFCVSGPAVAGRFVPTQPCCPRRRPGGRSLGQG